MAAFAVSLMVWMGVCVVPAQGLVLSDVAKARPRPLGAPKLNDICYSSRWPRPINADDPHDTFKAAKTFHATRIDWSYSNDVDFIKKVKAAGLVYFGAISSEMRGVGATAGREKDVNGQIIGNPELDFLMARGDVNSDEYRRIVMHHLKLLIDGGADGIQVDDPGMTYHNMQYLGGGYGNASLIAFRDYLETHTTPRQRNDWSMPDDFKTFDYAAYVRRHNENSPPPVKTLFTEFHRQSLDAFYKDIRSAVDKYAGRHVPFSCNNWSSQKQDEFPFKQHFDFWVGETSVQYGLPTAQRIYEKVKTAEALGKVQVFSPPNDGFDRIPTRDEYIAITRKLIATSYAAGSATLVPWDVWRRGPGTPRFFGTAAEFGDLYECVARHADLFADHEEVFAVGSGVHPQFAEGLTAAPIRIPETAKQVIATVRATPNAPSAPIVIHLVDWSDAPAELTLDLRNDLFGHPDDATIPVRLIRPGQDDQTLRMTPHTKPWTRLNLPPLTPYALLVVAPPNIVP